MHVLMDLTFSASSSMKMREPMKIFEASTSLLKDSTLLASRSSSSRYPTTSKQTYHLKSDNVPSQQMFALTAISIRERTSHKFQMTPSEVSPLCWIGGQPQTYYHDMYMHSVTFACVHLHECTDGCEHVLLCMCTCVYMRTCMCG